MKPARNVPDPEIHLARTVRTRRKELGLTQAEVARRAGFSRTYYVGIEAGRQATMSVDRGERLGEVLHLTVGQLTGNQPIADRTSLEIVKELVAQISRDTIRENACKLDVMGYCVDEDMVTLNYVGFLVTPRAPLEEIVGSRDLEGIYLLQKVGDVTYENFRNWDVLLCRDVPRDIQDGSLCLVSIDGLLAVRRVKHDRAASPIKWDDASSESSPIQIECPGDAYDGRMISSSQIKGVVVACMPRPYPLNRSR